MTVKLFIPRIMPYKPAVPTVRWRVVPRAAQRSGEEDQERMSEVQDLPQYGGQNRNYRYLRESPVLPTTLALIFVI